MRWIWFVAAAVAAVSVSAQAAKTERAPFLFRTVTDEARCKALVTQAARAEADGRPDVAAAAYEKAWGIGGDPELLLKMTSAYERSGEVLRALETLDWYRAHAAAGEEAALRDRRDRLAAQLGTAE